MQNDGLRGPDKEQRDHSSIARDTPEGLKRERKGPLDKNVGRIYEEAAKQPQSPGQPAKGQ